MSGTVAIYDPQFITRQGIETLVKSSDLFNEVHLIDTQTTIFDSLKKLTPSFLLIDYAKSKEVDIALVRKIKKEFKGLKTLVISEDNDKARIQGMIQAGIKGFVTKSCSEKEIIEAMDTIQTGGKFYCKKVLNIIASGEDYTTRDLSVREMEIVKLIANGKSSAQIADHLIISVHTVNSHRKNILKKLGLKSPTELIIYASEMGWVQLSE